MLITLTLWFVSLHVIFLHRPELQDQRVIFYYEIGGGKDTRVNRELLLVDLSAALKDPVAGVTNCVNLA